jgi:sialic acid synthase SpsE
MATIFLENGTAIQDFSRPYFVAELNTSHNGSLDLAKEMVRKAKEAGCDCVKFQSWSQDSLYSKTFYQANPIAKRFVSKFALSEDSMREVADFCRAIEIAFSSTPYCEREVDFLLECGVPFIKVASMDLVNYKYLRYIASTGEAVVLSTGMGSLDEIRRAVGVFEDAGNASLCILHCTSIYPAAASEIRLMNILGLRRAFPQYPIGFSDHSLGIEMAIASVGMGAALIEKHFTLDRSKIGMDNQMSTEPAEMQRLVQGCRIAAEGLGSPERQVSAAELEQRQKMRRSIVALRDLQAGTALSEQDLGAKRPGTGIPPERIGDLIGRVVVRDIAADTVVLESDLETAFDS